MGKRIGWIAAVVLVVGLVAGFAARTMAGDNGSTGKPSRTITVSSTAVVQTRPNEAVVDLGVQAQAFARNAQDMQAVLGALQTAGIKHTDIKTLNVSLERQEAGRGATRHQVFVAGLR